MKTQSTEIIKAVLKNDGTIPEIAKEQVLAILTGSTPPTKPQLLTQTESAKFLSVSRQTVYMMVKRGFLKPAILPNGIKRYRVQDLKRLAGIEEVSNG